MIITISNALEVSKPTREVIEYCKDNLVILNPDYISKERMGKWIGNTPRDLYLYEKRGDVLYIPYGCKESIFSIAGNYQKTWDNYPDISNFKADYGSSIELYEYQEKVVQAMLKAVHGVVVMPCGSGKTQTALEAVARIGLKTLWLTHTQDLLHQSLERAKSCFRCNKDMYGTITAGKVDISKGITFATVQTMCKLDLSEYKKEWAVVIVDECQHCCGSPTRMTQFYKVVNSLYAPYKFGLTATPDRNDGLEKSMYALLGKTISEISREQVSNTTCKVKIETVETGYFPNYETVLNGDGTINYTNLVTDLITNSDRFSSIMSVINDRCRSRAMVLASRVAYLEAMQQAYVGRSICLSSLGNSQKAKNERKDALQKLNSGKIDCIFATYQLAAEGLDCRELRYIVFATPEKDKRIITQAVGRVARKAEGKEFGTVIDVVDALGIYQGWAKKRRGYYTKLGCEFV